MSEVTPCPCGDDDPAGCMYVNAGYPWCRTCREHHRQHYAEPDCPIDEQGRSLNRDTGLPWDE